MNHRRSRSVRLEKRAKEFRRLHQERRRLWLEKFHAPFVEIEEPFIRGYERFFILTDEARERSDAPEISEALSFFQNHQRCRHGFFRHGSPGPRKGGWRKGEVAPHQLKRTRLADLEKVKFPRHLGRYIHHASLDLSRAIPPRRYLTHYQFFRKASFAHRKLLKSHVQPYLVTHLPLHDPALEARLDSLDKILNQSGHQGELSKAIYQKHWHWNHRPLYEKFIREDFRQQLHEANSDPSIKSAVSPRFLISLVIIVY